MRLVGRFVTVIACLGAAASAFGNLRFEKPLAAGRDGLDLITSVGSLHGVGGAVRVGVEALGDERRLRLLSAPGRRH
jgi:hypothetical protein